MLVPVTINRFPSAIYMMKSLNLVTTLAIAAAVTMSGVGCKKTPKAVTSIPRTNLSPIGEDASANIKLPPGQAGKGPGNGARLTDADGLNNSKLGSGTDIGTKPIDLANAGNQPGHLPEGTPEDAKILAAETVYFEYDRSSVKSSEVPKVQRVATYLKNQPNAMLRVEGNCDERGTEEYNRSLGERRALAVRELLIASGVAPDRVTTVTYGEDKPAESGHDEAAWSKNRRADFVVLTPGAATPAPIQ
jgi:peptidoglycan-associated lipoprotein